jgi:hypothetical protein
MVRGRRDLDWSQYLAPGDRELIDRPIAPDGWYPMETFERLGVAILKEIALGQLAGVRMWGRFQTDALAKLYPELVATGDPRDTLYRFRVLRTRLFDYDAVDIRSVHDEAAEVRIAYGMGPVAEEAASMQAVGFFERLLEISGAENVFAKLAERAWAGAPETRLELSWNVSG